MKTARNARTYRAVAIAFCTVAIGVAAVVGVHSFNGTSNTVTPISGSVQIAGSETMRSVVTTCAEEFMTRNPQSDVIVKGGGSGDGIAALLHELVDIGMASRDLTARERDYAASQGIRLAVTGSASSLVMDAPAALRVAWRRWTMERAQC